MAKDTATAKAADKKNPNPNDKPTGLDSEFEKVQLDRFYFRPDSHCPSGVNVDKKVKITGMLYFEDVELGDPEAKDEDDRKDKRTLVFKLTRPGVCAIKQPDDTYVEHDLDVGEMLRCNRFGRLLSSDVDRIINDPEWIYECQVVLDKKVPHPKDPKKKMWIVEFGVNRLNRISRREVAPETVHAVAARQAMPVLPPAEGGTSFNFGANAKQLPGATPAG